MLNNDNLGRLPDSVPAELRIQCTPPGKENCDCSSNFTVRSAPTACVTMHSHGKINLVEYLLGLLDATLVLLDTHYKYYTSLLKSIFHPGIRHY